MNLDPVLVIERDPSVLRQLTELLARAGCDVFGVDTPDTLVRALQRKPFPLVVVDANLPMFDVRSFIATVTTVSPSTAVIVTGMGLNAGQVVQIMRSGAADVLTKPFDPIDVTKRIREVLDQRGRSSPVPTAKTVPTSQPRLPLSAIADSTDTPAGFHQTPPLAGQTGNRYIDFVDETLRVFVELEQENMELTRRVQELENPALAARRKRRLVAWLAHMDNEFLHGMISLGSKLQLDFRPPLQTGGEVMDRLGSERPDLLFLSDMLPDMPGQIVAETASSEWKTVAVIVVSGWGSASMSADLVGPGNAETAHRDLTSVDDLIALIELARQRCFDADLGREFAQKFSTRHGQFLERVADIKQSILRNH